MNNMDTYEPKIFTYEFLNEAWGYTHITIDFYLDGTMVKTTGTNKPIVENLNQNDLNLLTNSYNLFLHAKNYDLGGRHRMAFDRGSSTFTGYLQGKPSVLLGEGGDYGRHPLNPDIQYVVKNLNTLVNEESVLPKMPSSSVNSKIINIIPKIIGICNQ
jgi:hypothetical protein